MKKEFVPHKLSVKLKELGFDEPCFGWYSTKGVFYSDINANSTIELNTMTNRGSFANAILSPLYQQAFRWFRENYGLDSFCRQTNLGGRSYFKISRIETDEIIKGYSNFTNTYEEAELACLEKLIEIVGQTNADMTENGVYK